MNIYRIKRNRNDDLYYDEAWAFVVVAVNEDAVRELLSGPGDRDVVFYGNEGPEAWSDPDRSDIEYLGQYDGKPLGGPRPLLRDFHAG